MNLFDTHAHYNCNAYSDDRDELLQKLLSDEVCGIIDCCAQREDFEGSLALSQRYSQVYCGIGLHPEALCHNTLDKLLLTVKEDMPELLNRPKVIALGECGLDYHYDMDKAEQMQLLEAQLDLGNRLAMPILLHCRDAYGDMLTALKKYRPQGVLHCFSGSVEFMHCAMSLGLHIGIGGVVTFKNAKEIKAVVAAVPQDRLLLETDCPYLAPEPFRGKRCHSGLMIHTAKAIADIRGESVDRVCEYTAQNAKRLFRIDV